MDAPTPLKGSELRKLKALAQKLEPGLKVGKNGLSPGFIQSVNEELNRHELIKVKLAEFKERRKELAPELAEKTSSQLVMLVGNVFVLYRYNPNTSTHVISPSEKAD